MVFKSPQNDFAVLPPNRLCPPPPYSKTLDTHSTHTPSMSVFLSSSCVEALSAQEDFPSRPQVVPLIRHTPSSTWRAAISVLFASSPDSTLLKHKDHIGASLCIGLARRWAHMIHTLTRNYQAYATCSLCGEAKK